MSQDFQYQYHGNTCPVLDHMKG